jgi:membrane-bound serine protease (ClpP class)
MTGDFLLPVVLQLVGVGVIIAEFVLPSGGLLSIAAAGCLGYSLFHVFYYISPRAGFLFALADVVAIPVLVIVGIKLLARSPVTLRTSLSRERGVGSQDAELAQLVGKSGQVVTDLRPAGKASIDGRRFDVVSEGDYIDAAQEVVVTGVGGNRIVVRKKETES